VIPTPTKFAPFIQQLQICCQVAFGKHYRCALVEFLGFFGELRSEYLSAKRCPLKRTGSLAG
jgi:hypothetical protein